MKKKTEKIGRSGTPNEEANGITRTLKSEAERGREGERERGREREQVNATSTSFFLLQAKQR